MSRPPPSPLSILYIGFEVLKLFDSGTQVLFQFFTLDSSRAWRESFKLARTFNSLHWILKELFGELVLIKRNPLSILYIGFLQLYCPITLIIFLLDLFLSILYIGFLWIIARLGDELSTRLSILYIGFPSISLQRQRRRHSKLSILYIGFHVCDA